MKSIRACVPVSHQLPGIAAGSSTDGPAELAAALTKAISAVASNSSSRKVKIAEVADITWAVEADYISKDDVDACVARYVKLKHRIPKPNEMPSHGQLTALRELLKAGTTYVDFSRWGPHGARMARALKHEGVILAPDGSLILKEMFAPPDFAY